MNKLNRCFLGDVDSIEMYILSEELDFGEGREFRNFEKFYQFILDIIYRFNYNVGEIFLGERYLGNGEDIERYIKLFGCTKYGLDMKEEVVIERRGGLCFFRVGQCQDKVGFQGEEELAYCFYCGIYIWRFIFKSFRFLVFLFFSVFVFVQVQ